MQPTILFSTLVKKYRIATLLFFGVSMLSPAAAQKNTSTMSFTVLMAQPQQHTYQVEFTCVGIKKDTLIFKMPVWMPGLYQVMNYADHVDQFQAVDGAGKNIRWERLAPNGWRVFSRGAGQVTVRYTVKATRSFVAENFLDAEHGYIVPPALFMHVVGHINHPVTVSIKPVPSWTHVATGLDPVAGQKYTYTAPDFDILYDCPILMGNLEELPSFAIKGVVHRFIGYRLGSFDRRVFIDQLKKSVEAGVGIIGDVPYKHYTFLAIGPGRGGVEHLNSTAVSFDGAELNTAAGSVRMQSFLAHEYFHHYNVKRIRPLELGPFDYDRGTRTNALWISEGITVYYEYIMLKRAGLVTEADFLGEYQSIIATYENKPGHLFQSLAQSSYDTWSGNPFTRTDEELNKKISYYDKGAIVALFLDFAIRHGSENKKSLDDVMRALYKEYYQDKKRGFSDAEFQSVCELMAGTPLTEIFEYVYTVKDVDYNKYLAYGGLTADVTPKALPGGWLGIQTTQKNDSLLVTKVDWHSPAWHAGVHSKTLLLNVNGSKVNKQQLDAMLASAHEGQKINLQLSDNGVTKEIDVVLSKQMQASFALSFLPNPDALQAAILKSWIGR